jgi:peroxiredoxin
MIKRNVLMALAYAWLVACGAKHEVQPEPAAEPAPALAPAPAADKPAASGAAMAQPSASAELGKPAPDFTLVDTDGKTHKLAELRGKTVVLEWFNPDCPFVRFAHTKGELKDNATRVAAPELVWLSINSGAPGKQGHGAERNKEARGEYAMPNPVLLDESGAVGRAYGAQKTPHMFVVDAKGVLVYRGGIDNAPMGVVDAARPRPSSAKEGDRVNYVNGALGDLKRGGPLGLPDTPPYGCSVKYAS